MCGITGIFHLSSSQPVSESLLQAMNQAQFHRGPNEGSLHIEAGLGFGHRRLSIIDISSGQQPLWDVQRRACVVFNGEIYNYQSLREELIALGCQFNTHSDTEVIVQAWLTWGEACVERLRGMFAFAIWDPQQQSLFLARDRLGIKPLFYCQLADGTLLFASELKSLLLHPSLSREIRPEAIEEFFALGYVPEPHTIYKQAFKLPPGHTLTLKRDTRQPSVKQFWDVEFAPTEQSFARAREELIENLDEAVRIRLMSEVPLGAFLSGGVDSSAVVASMATQTHDAVKTCSIGFDIPNYDETDFARQVAKQYQTDHLEREVISDDFDLLDKLAALYDEPYADSSAIPTYRVCQLAKERVTVCLSGDGGDEVFAGYRRYLWHMREEKIRGMLPHSVRSPLFGFLGNTYPKLDWAPRFLRAKSTFQGLARSSVEGYLHSVSLLSDLQRQALFSGDLLNKLDGYRVNQVFERHAGNFTGDDPLALIQYLDMKTYLVGDILTKVDRASMAHALEVRVPFLDHKLVEWAAKLPAQHKMQQGEGKYLLKKGMEQRLPNDVLYRRKMGFAVPISRWFRGPLRDRLQDEVLKGELVTSGLFDERTLQRLVQEHTQGIREHSAPLWSLMMFAAFLKRDGIAHREVSHADTASARSFAATS